MRNKIVVLVALVAVAGFAAAGALTVKQRNEAASVHAERFTLGDMLVFSSSTLGPVLGTASAQGTAGAPVEMTASFPLARTALTIDNWQYAVEIKEKSNAAIASGIYEVQLVVDGNPLPKTVIVQQNASDPAAQEGARVVFDLGSEIQSSSLYYVVVKPYQPPLDLVSYTVRSGFEGTTSRWYGVGGTIADQVNPTITLAMGKTLSLTGRNGDGSGALPHNIVIKNSGGTVAGPSDPFSADGASETLTWTPSAAATYTYYCAYHSTMTGTITVA